MENVIMMINNAGDALAQKENKSFTACKDESESPCK